MRIVGYSWNFEDNGLQLTLSSTNKKNDSTFELEELLSKANSTSTNISVNSSKYSAYVDSGERNELLDYITGTLDLAAQGARLGRDKEIEMQGGITLSNVVDDGRKIKLMNNMLVVTSDNFQTADVAITPDGVFAEKLYGEIILGTELIITTGANGNFLVDENGVQINGNNFTITNTLPTSITDYADGKFDDLSDIVDDLDLAIEDFSSDLVITRPEANSLEAMLNQVVGESVGLVASGNGLSLTTEVGEYETALTTLTNTLNSYIDQLSYPIAITLIQRTDMNSEFDSLQNKKTLLIDAINKKYTDDNALILGQEYNNFSFTAANGAVVTTTSGLTRTTMNATSGFKIENRAATGSIWGTAFEVDSAGDLYADGTITARELIVDGVDVLSNVGDLSQINADLGDITAGSIDIGNGTFEVDSSGNVTANSLLVTGGDITGVNINSDTFTAQNRIDIITNDYDEGLYMTGLGGIEMYFRVYDPAGKVEIGPSVSVTNELFAGGYEVLTTNSQVTAKFG